MTIRWIPPLLGTAPASSIDSDADITVVDVRNLVDKVFDGAPSAMVMRLLDDEDLSPDELRRIRRLLKEKLG